MICQMSGIWKDTRGHEERLGERGPAAIGSSKSAWRFKETVLCFMCEVA